MCFKKAAWIGLCSTFSTQIFLTPFSLVRQHMRIGKGTHFLLALMFSSHINLWVEWNVNCVSLSMCIWYYISRRPMKWWVECLAHLVGSHWTRNMGMLQKQSGGDIAGWSMHSVILLSAVLPETVNEEFLNSSNVCTCALCVCVCVWVCVFVWVWHR